MYNQGINIEREFAKISEYWSPVVVAELNGHQIKLAKFRGEFERHKHTSEDECFFVFKGEIAIHYDDKIEEVGVGEIITVAAGVYHKPVAEKEAWVILFEPATTVREGD